MDRRTPLQREERGPHEHLERDRGAHRVSGQAEQQRRVPAGDRQHTESLRLAGLQAHARERHRRRQLVADDFERACADPAGEHDDVDGCRGARIDDVAQRATFVVDARAAVDLGTGGLGHRREQQAVGLGDLSAAQGRAGFDEFAAGRDDRDARTAGDDDVRDARRGHCAQLQRPEQGARAEHRVARAQVFTGATDVRGRSRRLQHGRLLQRVSETADGVFERDDRVGVGRDG